MKIKKELKKKLEAFLNAYEWDTNDHEFGGFLLQSRRTENIDSFLPIPNIAESPKNRYRMPDKAWATAKRLAKAMKKNVVVHWHSHPDPLIMSSADVKASEYYEKYRSLVFIIIAPTSSRYTKEWAWYACSGVKPVILEYV